MPKMIFVNLPVADIAASTAFYEAIGAVRDPRFCNESTSMMAFSETITVMLLAHDAFAGFTSKTIVDARTASEVLICLSEDSRAGVDAMLERAIAAGARDFRPVQDHGFMYGRSFEDPDGHVFEIVWMDVGAMMAAMPPAAEPVAA